MRIRQAFYFFILLAFMCFVASMVLFDIPSHLTRKNHIAYAIDKENSLINFPLKSIYNKNSTSRTKSSGRITSTMSQPTTLPKRPEIVKKTYYPLTIDSPYLINNPNICREVKNLTFVVIVHTAPNHFERRRTIRETWANKNLYTKISVRIVFLLGKPINAKLQFSIKNENRIYRDLIQGNFQDSYKNLTHKGVLGFRWITENCQHAKMVIKVDDDVYVNIFKLYTEIFPKYHNKSRYILCHVRNKGSSTIFRSKDRVKWQVKDDVFQGLRYYPTTYCNGFIVFIASDLIRALYQASFSTPFFWVDDVYLYGMLPAKVHNVSYHNLVSILTLDQGNGLRCFVGNSTCKYVVSNAWTPDAMKRFWVATLAKLKNDSLQYVNPQLFSSLRQTELQNALTETYKQVLKMYPPKKPKSKKNVAKKKTVAKKSLPQNKTKEAAKNATLQKSINSHIKSKNSIKIK